jgi:hypothetical protein
VLSELYQCELITGGDVEEMKKLRGDLVARIVLIQFCKETVTVDQTVTVMKKHDVDEPIWKLLKVLSELYGNNIHLLVHHPLDRTLVRIQYHKGADVVSKTTDIMAKHGFPVNYLKVLSELYGSKLLSELYGSRVDNKRGSRREHSLVGTPSARQNTGTYPVSQRC